MITRSQLLLVYIFQIIPLLIYPPETLKSGLVVIGVIAIIFALLGYGLWRGRQWALSLSLCMQGFNVIIRLMMLFPHAMTRLSEGGFVLDVPYVVLGVASILLSGWFLLRLDRPDVRSTIVA
jgi:hypothetical protein